MLQYQHKLSSCFFFFCFFAPFVSLCFQLLKRLVHKLFSFPLRRVGWVIQDSGSECPCFISAIQTFYNAT